MNPGRVRRSLAAACVLPLLLAGCSEDEPTPQIPDPTASPSAVETDTGPVEPTLPPEAEGDGKEAAEAFVGHYFDYINYAQTTGDVEGLLALGLASCNACRGGVEFISKIYKRGGSNEGGDYSVLSSDVTGRRQVTARVAYFYLDVVAEHTRQVVSGAGDLDRTYEAGQATWRFQVVTGPRGLRISEWSAK
ncbi:DUF6318 family protein [Nocardioides sp. P5_C9_2]